MTCPRCGQSAGDDASCPKCGVVFAKLRPSEPRLASPPTDRPASPSSDSGSAGSRLFNIVAVGAVAVAAAILLARHEKPAPSPPASVPREVSVPGPEIATVPPLAPVSLAPPPPEALAAPASALPDADTETLARLGAKLKDRASISEGDLEAGEGLLSRHPAEPAARALLESMLIASGSEAQRAGQPARAALRLRRLVELRPRDTAAQGALVSALLEASDWPGAEAAARALLSGDRRNSEALRALGFALMRQDRSPEALEALRASLEAREDSATRALFDRVQKSLKDEQGMTEQRLAHFHVRYDGDAHEDVGREILRALERHYATLSRTFDHQPTTTIPVVLFTQRGYFDATGAPFWSGGQYSHFDGRITIPIGGLTSALTPSLDQVLIHEVTHAFVHDLSHGLAPRDVHEGLAQYLEGKRVESELGSGGMTALAEGRLPGVMAFYYSSLAFVEQLMAERGQGGMNDLLRAMGETNDVDEAFRRVYGRTHVDAARAWGDRLRLQHAR